MNEKSNIATTICRYDISMLFLDSYPYCIINGTVVFMFAQS